MKRDRLVFFERCYECGERSGAAWDAAELTGTCAECGSDETGMEVVPLSELTVFDAVPDKPFKRRVTVQA